MARPIKRLKAEPEVVEELRRRSRARTSRVRDRQRAEIILLRLEGVSVAEIAVRLETTAKRVSMWSKRLRRVGSPALKKPPDAVANLRYRLRRSIALSPRSPGRRRAA